MSDLNTRTVTFQPDDVAGSLLKKAVDAKGKQRGLQTKIINQALHHYLQSYAGKKEKCRLAQLLTLKP